MRATDIMRRRRRRAWEAANPGARLRRVLLGVALVTATALVVLPLVAAAGAAAGWFLLTRDLPDVDVLRDLPARYAASTATTRLYTLYGTGNGDVPPVLIDEIADPRAGGAGWVRPTDLPDFVSSAFLAVLDPSFLAAARREPVRSLRDWWRTGELSPATSPLIHDLIRSNLPDTVTATTDSDRRAVREWLLGWQIERRFSRPLLLEWALNTRYYGHLAYGVEAAAHLYFDKGAADLTTAEAALLAAVSRFPAANPYDEPEAARAGQVAVLGEMVRQKALTQHEAAAALAEPLSLAPPPWAGSVAPAFARLARYELEAILGPERLVRGGWQVEATLDWELQLQAMCVSKARASAAGTTPGGLGGGQPCPARDLLPARDAGAGSDTAIVALDPATGAIRALVGGDETLSPRPTGTLARPFIYLTALSQGFTAASLTLDTETIYLQAGRPYAPANEDGDYLGPLRLREALLAGRTIPAVQVLSWVGVDQVEQTARALGLVIERRATVADLNFAERGFAADLLHLAHAFAAVGNGGAQAGVALGTPAPRPAAVARIGDARGAEVYAFAPISRETLTPELAYLLTDMLAGGERLPGGRPAALARGASAATGDAWAIGYTPDQLVAAYANGDSDAPADVQTALLSWMTNRAEEATATTWPRPSGLRAVDVCKLSGMRPRRDGAVCDTVREWFVAGTEPSAVDSMTQEVAVNRETGRLATIFTPPHLIERRTFAVYPSAATKWANDRGLTGAPAEYDTIRRVPVRDGGAAVTSPEPWSVVSGQWSVAGSAGGESFSSYRLAYFPGLLPEAIQVVAEGGAPVETAELAVWDTTLVEDGLYTLLLTVVHQDGTFDEVAIPVTTGNGE